MSTRESGSGTGGIGPGRGDGGSGWLRCERGVGVGWLLVWLTWFGGGLLSAEAVRSPVTSMVFTKEGRELLSARGASVEVRAAGNERVEYRFGCGLKRVSAMAMHPGGGVVVVGGGSPGERGECVVLGWPDRREVQRLGGFTDMVVSVGFSPDGGWLAVGSHDRTVRVFRRDPATGLYGEGRRLADPTGPVRAVAFSPGGEFLVTAGLDRSLKVWGVPGFGRVRTLNNHTEGVNGVVFAGGAARGESDARAVCVSVSEDRTARVWQPGIGRMVRILRGHAGGVLAVAMDPVTGGIYTAGTDGVLRRFEAGSDLMELEERVGEDWIYCLAVDGRGEMLAMGLWGGEVRWRRLRGG